MLDAIHDVLSNTSEVVCKDAWKDASHARDRLLRKLGAKDPYPNERPLSGSWREYQVLELRLYRYARLAVLAKTGNDAHPPSGELKFLASHIKAGDTWATFIAFEKEWTIQHASTRQLERWLPRIDEISEEFDESGAYKPPAEDPRQLVKQVEKRLSEILTSGDDKQTRMAEALGILAKHTSVFHEKTSATMAALGTQIAGLKAANGRLKGVAYITAVLLLLVLWKLR